MPWFTGLDSVARKTGFPVVESPGWKTNGHRAMSGCQAIIIHHTATTNTTANAPTLNYVRNNKLSHFVLGRDGTIYVTGAGFQGHAGKDSLVSPAHARNATSIGIEAENNGTGEPWPDVQMESYVRLVRALIDEFNLPVSRVYGHKEIALTAAGKLGRKTDPTFNMDTFRAAIKRGHWAAVINPAATEPATPPTPKEEDIMTPDQEAKLDRVIALISESDRNNQGRANSLPAQVWAHEFPHPRTGNNTPARAYLASGYANTQALHAMVEAIAKKSGIDPAEVERIIRDAIEEGLAAGVELEATLNVKEK